jgi:hypothetical protein
MLSFSNSIYILRKMLERRDGFNLMHAAGREVAPYQGAALWPIQSRMRDSIAYFFTVPIPVIVVGAIARMGAAMKASAFVVALAIASAGVTGTQADTFPSRPVTVIVPYPAGGPTDTLARILADHMKNSLGEPIIVENVSGAGGSIGVARVARAAPDGYTLSIGHWNTHVVLGATMNLSFDVLNAFAPVALLADTPIWLVARKDCRRRPSRSLLLGSSKTRAKLPREPSAWVALPTSRAAIFSR